MDAQVWTKEQESASRAVGRALERARGVGLALRIQGGTVALTDPHDDDTWDGSIDPDRCLYPRTSIDAHGGG